MVVLDTLRKKIGIIGWKYVQKEKPAKGDSGNSNTPNVRPGLINVVKEGTGPNVDIVYVHGLNGGGNASQVQETFSTTELSNRNPNARILSWSYDTRAYSSGYKVEDALESHTTSLLDSLATVRSEAESSRRPIVFIAQSLGGALVKKALLKSNEAGIEPGPYTIHAGIKQSTLAAVFLGSDYDKEPLKPENLESVADKLSELQNEEFHSLCKGISVKNVHCSPTSPSPPLVNPSPRWSSTRFISGIRRTKTSSSSETDASSQQITEFPQNVLETVSSLCSSSSLEHQHGALRRDHEKAQTPELDNLKDDFNIGAVPKLTASKPFIGREEKLSELLGMLSPRSHKESDSRIVVLHAPTGSGKTSLALECCQRNEKLFSTIFWINANSVQSIQSSYAAFAKALTEHYVTQLADSFNSYDAVYRHLGLSDLVNDKIREDGFDQIAGTPLVDAINVWFSQVCNTDWLMVLDNIDESDITIIKDFFPTPVLGHILVITRLDGYAEKHRYPVVELGNMTRVESQKLLMSLIHAHDSDKDNALALTVVDGCNSPLSIAQAANFINTISLSLQEYLDITETTNHKWSPDLWDSYDETKVDEILNAQQPWSNDQWNSYSDPTVTAYSSWADKIEQLQSSDRTAFDLLTLCSFFAKDMIPVDLLKEAVTASSLEEGRRLEDILEDLDRRSLITRQSCIASRKSRDNDAISSISGRDSPEFLFPVLERSSGSLNFLFRQPSPSEVASCISIHPLVHSWAQKRLYPVAQGVMAERAFKALALAIQSSNIPPSDLIELDKFLPHLKSCLESVDMVDGDPKSDVKWSVLADVCRYQGLHDRARQFYEFSLKRVEAETVLVTSRIEASSVRMRLGFVYVQQKHLDKAETEYKKAMDHIFAAKRETGNRDDNTKIANLELRIFASLASLYKTQNRFEEAEARYYSILPRFEEVWGSEDIRTLLLLEQFASCLLANGNLEEAEALYRRVLVSYVKEFGRDHPTVAKIQQKLAKTLQLKGRYEHAEGFLQQALTATEKRLGKEHPETVKLLVFLAQLKCFCRKFNEAEKIYLELLISQTAMSGSSNAASLELRVNLGMTYQAQKKYADAEKMYQKALDDLRNQKDKSLQHERELMLKLKALYEEIGAADKVKQLLGEILEKFPQVPL